MCVWVCDVNDTDQGWDFLLMLIVLCAESNNKKKHKLCIAFIRFQHNLEEFHGWKRSNRKQRYSYFPGSIPLSSHTHTHTRADSESIWMWMIVTFPLPTTFLFISFSVSFSVYSFCYFTSAIRSCVYVLPSTCRLKGGFIAGKMLSISFHVLSLSVSVARNTNWRRAVIIVAIVWLAIAFSSALLRFFDCRSYIRHTLTHTHQRYIPSSYFIYLRWTVRSLTSRLLIK